MTVIQHGLSYDWLRRFVARRPASDPRERWAEQVWQWQVWLRVRRCGKRGGSSLRVGARM
jgi:hypothetical protein